MFLPTTTTATTTEDQSVCDVLGQEKSFTIKQKSKTAIYSSSSSSTSPDHQDHPDFSPSPKPVITSSSITKTTSRTTASMISNDPFELMNSNHRNSSSPLANDREETQDTKNTSDISQHHHAPPPPLSERDKRILFSALLAQRREQLVSRAQKDEKVKPTVTATVTATVATTVTKSPSPSPQNSLLFFQNGKITSKNDSINNNNNFSKNNNNNTISIFPASEFETVVVTTGEFDPVKKPATSSAGMIVNDDLTPACQRVQTLRQHFRLNNNSKRDGKEEHQSPFLTMISNCCFQQSGASNNNNNNDKEQTTTISNSRANLQKYFKLKRLEESKRFLERQEQFLFAQKEHQTQSRSVSFEKRTSASLPRRRRSPTPLIVVDSVSTKTKSQRSSSYSRECGSSRVANRNIIRKTPSSSSSPSPSPRNNNNKITTPCYSSSSSSFIPTISRFAHNRPNRGVADMARDYVKQQEKLRKLRQEKERREDRELTFTPRTRNYYVSVVSENSVRRPQSAQPTRTTATSTTMIHHQRDPFSRRISSSSSYAPSSSLPPLARSVSREATTTNNFSSSFSTKKTQRLLQPVESRLSNLNRYMSSLYEKEERMEEFRHFSQKEKERKELEQCSFRPRTTSVPLYIQRMRQQ